MVEVVLVIGGVVVGSVVAWVLAASRARVSAERERSGLQAQLAAAQGRADALDEQRAAQDASIETLRKQLDLERNEHTAAQTRLEAETRRFAEQQKMWEQAEKKLKESFESLSAKALRSNAEQFLQSARKTLDVLLTDARGDLGKREEAIQSLVKPIAESLKRYETQIQSLEQARQKAYGSLEEQVKALGSTNQLLQQETGKLVTALRDPKVRGRWGELALRRSAELAGMIEHCDFDQQVSVHTDDARFRPDMVVHLPGGREVVIDAKAVLDAYLDAVAATDEPTRLTLLKRHASQVRSRLKELAGKSYAEKVGSAIELVVLFLPAESFFSAAVEADPALLEDAAQKGVVIASPMILIALLRAMAYGWQQERLAENAEQIRAIGRELHERLLKFVKHLEKIGNHLGQAVRAYNDTVGSFESRVLPSARRLKELGAASGETIPGLQPIDHSPRSLTPTRDHCE